MDTTVAIKISIRSAVSHGLETVQIFVNDAYATEHLSLAASLTWVKAKFPDVQIVYARVP